MTRHSERQRAGRPAAVHLGPGWQRLLPAAWLEGWNPERFELEGGWTEVVTMGAGPPLDGTATCALRRSPSELIESSNALVSSAS